MHLLRPYLLACRILLIALTYPIKSLTSYGRITTLLHERKALTVPLWQHCIPQDGQWIVCYNRIVLTDPTKFLKYPPQHMADLDHKFVRKILRILANTHSILEINLVLSFIRAFRAYSLDTWFNVLLASMPSKMSITSASVTCSLQKKEHCQRTIFSTEERIYLDWNECSVKVSSGIHERHFIFYPCETKVLGDKKLIGWSTVSYITVPRLLVIARYTQSQDGVFVTER